MKHFLAIGFLLNLGLVMFAFKLLGLVFVLVLAIGIYKAVLTKFPSKSDLAEKLMFGSSYIIGVIAVHNIFGNPGITFTAGLLEAVFFIIFASL